jgi:hypothetical protein
MVLPLVITADIMTLTPRSSGSKLWTTVLKKKKFKVEFHTLPTAV